MRGRRSQVGRGLVGRGALAVAVAGLAVVAPVPAGTAPPAEAASVLAHWEMSEAPGDTVLHDASGNGAHGTIGSAVMPTGLGHLHWSNVKPNEPPAKPERLVLVDDARLNPGTRDYAVTFRYRTTRSFGNILQKGQATTRGGQWKVQLPKGHVSCLYRGAEGRRAIKTSGTYNDGQWHTVRCARTSTRVTVSVHDQSGVLQESKRINGPTGDLSNHYAVTMGGKQQCDQITVTCDYFAGDIDWVRIEAG